MITINDFTKDTNYSIIDIGTIYYNNKKFIDIVSDYFTPVVKKDSILTCITSRKELFNIDFTYSGRLRFFVNRDIIDLSTYVNTANFNIDEIADYFYIEEQRIIDDIVIIDFLKRVKLIDKNKNSLLIKYLNDWHKIPIIDNKPVLTLFKSKLYNIERS